MSTMSSVRTLLDWLSSIAVLVAATLLIWTMTVTRVPGIALPPPAVGADGANAIRDVEQEGLRLTETSSALGSSQGARVAVIEFSDFDCPFCRRHASETLPELKRDFVDTGKISYLFMNFPLENIHPQAFGAAQAAICASEQGKFWSMHSVLFERAVPKLESIGRTADTIGLDLVAFDACMRRSDTRVKANLSEGERLGVRSTPTFFVGTLASDGKIDLKRRIEGAYPIQVFRAAIEQLTRSN